MTGFASNTVVYKGEDWYISYLPSTPETAIVKEDVKEDSIKCTYYILNGDWRDYFDQANTWGEAVELYKPHHEEHGSFWSEYGEE